MKVAHRSLESTSLVVGRQRKVAVLIEIFCGRPSPTPLAFLADSRFLPDMHLVADEPRTAGTLDVPD
ncbi:MAG: hypothetical protein CMJ78_19280 [Planctomycetaceae bacterium]|nr:hypothetical protein [Planctomycetaceae bacterium]